MFITFIFTVCTIIRRIVVCSLIMSGGPLSYVYDAFQDVN